jgi:hypothetical protein
MLLDTAIDSAQCLWEIRSKKACASGRSSSLKSKQTSSKWGFISSCQTCSSEFGWVSGEREPS